MTGLLRALDRWLFGPVPMHWAVAARFLLGSVLLVAWLRVLPDAPALLGPEGFGGATGLETVLGPAATAGLVPLLRFQATHSLALVLAACALLVFCAAAFAVGFRTRITGPLLLALSVALVQRNTASWHGAPGVLHQWLALVVLADPGRWASVDRWLAARRAGDPATAWTVGEASAWPLRLLQVGVIAMYSTAGWERLVDDGWLQGSMVFVGLSSLLHARFDIDWTAWRPLLVAMNHVTLVLEPAASLLLWFPSVRRFLVPVLLGFHLGLEVLMRTGWWQWTMLVGLIALLPPEWLARGWRRLTPAERG